MDYAPHGTLRQRHPKSQRLPVTTILTYTRQIAEALQYAHEQKLVHRDIKPENMLLGRNNEILLSDFGIALVSHTSSSQSTKATAGTIAYMAPEQVLGKPRPASDQYALGVVVYEWLCGERPFSGSFSEIATQHMFATPAFLREKVPAISSAVEDVVMTALRKDPLQRFANVKAFSNALEQASRIEQAHPSGSTSFTPQISDTFGTPSVTLRASEAINTPASSSTSTPAISDPAMIPPIAESIPTPRISEAGLTAPIAGQASSSPASGPIPTPTVSDPLLTASSAGHTGSPDVVSGPVIPPQQGSQLKRKRRLSRRAIIVGLPGLIVVGGVTAWLGTHWGSLITSAFGPARATPEPTAGQQPGTILFTYRGHTDGVTALAWSPNGRLIASASDDSTIRIWDATTGVTIHILEGHSSFVRKVAWSPDGTRIATGSSDKTVRLWDATSGKHIYTYDGHVGGVTSLAWSPDSKRIASGSSDKTVQVWKAN